MAIDRHEGQSLLHRRVHWCISYAAILAVLGSGAVLSIKEVDADVDANIYRDEKELAETVSELLFSDSERIEAKMEEVARDLGGNDNLDLYCGIPYYDHPLRAGTHRARPDGSDPYIVMSYIYCSTMDSVSRPGFDPYGEYPSDVQTQATIDGTFIFAHEVGHEVVGSSERAANCYAATNYAKFAEALDMPEVVIELPQNPAAFCD